MIHKVISLGGGTLGWVDLWRGIFLCNVLDEVPVVQVIQLPMLMPGNKGGLRVCPWNIRDIASSDGLIKLVEVETYERQIDEPVYDDILVVYDSDLLAEQPVRDNVGWKIITWYRMISWNYWRKECCRVEPYGEIFHELEGESPRTRRTQDRKQEETLN